jgi:Ca-activated chloride channel homolog
MMNRGLITASASNIARAQSYVASLEARGGTMMVPPLQAALAEQASAAMSNDATTTGASRLGQVIFLTDGAIGNEQQLFEVLTNGRGRSRIFMVGIGSAPNSFLMTRAAELGRGTFTHIGSEAQVANRMSALFEKLENPSVTNLNATFKDAAANVAPGILPDLYFGEPLVVAAKLKNSSSNLVIKGMIGPNPWTVTLPISNAISASGVSKLWARRKIADAEVDKILHPKSFDQVEEKITALALEHHLVSRVTSLVAIDKTPSRPESAKLTRADVPLNLPEGWDFDKVFGEQGGIVRTRDQRADAGAILAPRMTPLSPIQRQGFNNSHQVGQAKLTNAAFKDVRFAKVAKAAAPVKMVAGYKQTATHVILPQTATDAELRLWFGILALLLAVIIATWSWWFPGNRGELA